MKYLSQKQITTNIRLIKTAGDKLDVRIHESVVSILHHGRESGDYRQIKGLHEALPKSGRREAFVKYVEDHSPLKFDRNKLGWHKPKSSKREYLVEKAEATPFWDYTKEVVQTLNLDKLLDLNALLASVDKRIENAMEKGSPIEGDLVAFKERKKAIAQFAAVVH